MERKEIIDRLIQNENSVYTEADIELLNAMPEDFLKRTYLSAIGNIAANKSNTSVANSSDEQFQRAVSAGTQALKNVQKKIFELRATESQMLEELSGLGIAEKSIFNVDYSTISESDIDAFVQNSHSPVAQVLREALEIRNRGRVELISQVIANSHGLFTEEDLRHKTAEELHKLAALSGGPAQQYGAPPMQFDSPGMNWQGAGMGNIPITNEAAGGEPLGLPSTFTPKKNT